eukprot:1617784-Lingulodinium_polyedra.AAC.1
MATFANTTSSCKASCHSRARRRRPSSAWSAWCHAFREPSQLYIRYGSKRSQVRVAGKIETS